MNEPAKINVIEVKIWMMRKKLSQEDICKITGRKHSYVNQTINGHKHCREVLFYLEDQGCPRELLGLPERRA